ncbi:MAG: hypothetical protein FWC01_05120 [Treponema sp.]|nr:hypothetical protein [Treponema sp.]MCL2237668.1 hypothetical protein [Treponema sp.]
MKRKILMAGIIGVLLALTLSVSSCDLFETKGTIIVRNASPYPVDANITVNIRTNSSSGNLLGLYSRVAGPVIVAQNNSASFSLDSGKYDIYIVDGVNTVRIYPSSTWIDLGAGETRSFKFTGNSITID